MVRSLAAGLTLCLGMNAPAFAQAGGEISGRITAVDGTPAGGVRVSAVETASLPAGRTVPDEQASIVETGSDGRYRIEDLRPGRYYIVAGRIDSPTYYPGASRQVEAIALTVAAGSTIPDINFRITTDSSGMKVSGRVTSDPRLSRTVVQAVVLNNPLTNEQIGTPIADDGSFEFRRVPPGSYDLGVTPGLAYWFAWVTVPITVTDKDIAGIEFKVPVPVPVAGRIVIDDEAPPFSLTLSVQNQFTSMRATANFREDGSFVLILPEGEYRAVAQGFPSAYRLESITYGETDLLRAPMKIAFGDSNSMTIRFGVPDPPPWKTIRGRVSGWEHIIPLYQSHNGVIASPQVNLSSDPPLQGAQLTTSIGFGGSFEFSKVLPGKYTVSLPEMPESAVAIVVRDSDIADLEFVIPPAWELTGRVVMEADALLPRNITNIVSAVSVSGSVRITSQSRPDGTFTLRLPEGEYRLLPDWLPSSYAVKSMSYASADILKTPLRVRGPMPEQLLVTIGPTEPVVKVAGRVVNSISTAFPVAVLVESSSEQFRMETPIARDGSFEFAKVPPGTYRVSTQPFIPGTPALTVGAIRDISGLEVVIPIHRTIIGKVMVDAGPIPALSFILNGDYVGASSRSNEIFSLTLPEGEGRLQVDSLPLGYELKAFTYGTSDLLKNPLRVDGSGLNEIQVKLARTLPLVRIRGRIRNVEITPPTRLFLMGFSTTDSTFEAPVGTDGSFEFREIPAGVYAASLGGHRVIVSAREDVDDLEIAMPAQKWLTGRVVVEGDGPPPPFSLSLRPSGTEVHAFPNPDGRFSVTLAEGEYHVRVNVKPAIVYELKSITYGAANLLNEPLIPQDQDSRELTLTFSISPTIRWASVKGRVIGAQYLVAGTGRIPIRTIILNGDLPLQSVIDADGNFEFPKVPPGIYTLGTLLSGPTAVPIVVTGEDVTGLELTVPSR